MSSPKRPLAEVTSSGYWLQRYGAIVLLALHAPAFAIDDPMRPPNVPNLPIVTEAEADRRSIMVAPPVTYRLDSILISNKRSIALINGAALTVGDTIDGARLVDVRPTDITLRIAGANRTIKLLPLQVKKPSRDTSHEQHAR